jgi:hypothetical protein
MKDECPVPVIVPVGGFFPVKLVGVAAGDLLRIVFSR